MAEITYAEWMELTKKRFHRRTSTLKALDQAFKEYDEARTPGLKTQALHKLSKSFKNWTTLKGSEYLSSIRNRNEDASGRGPVERLQTLIRTGKLSNVAIVRDLQAEVPDRLVMEPSLRGLLDSAKVRETYTRSGLAVHRARDAMRKAGAAGTPERQLYERWFGTYDATRHATVMGNFKGLCNLFDLGVIIVHDARTLAGAWGDCFGFAMPGDKKNYVEFTVGRAFFNKVGYTVVPGATQQQRSRAVQAALAQAYQNTSDWTVGTMIHELGHATNALPDVDFMPPATYQVSPGGLTPTGWEQCSYPSLDQDLAQARPDLAVVNTDNYGQCAREALA